MRSLPKCTGASTFRRTAPLTRTRPARIASSARLREQYPIFEIARANPTLRCCRAGTLEFAAEFLGFAAFGRPSFFLRGFLSFIIDVYKRQTRRQKSKSLIGFRAGTAFVGSCRRRFVLYFSVPGR